MVDIAEIRKKARKKKQKETEKSSSEDQKTKEEEALAQVAAELLKDDTPEEEKKEVTEEKEVTETAPEEEEDEKSLVELAAETILQQSAFSDRIVTIENLEEFLGIKIEKEEYGLDIKKVTELIKVPEITDVPLTPDYVLGVIYLRGKVTPLISLRIKLGYPEKEIDKFSRVVIVNNGEEDVGLLVDEVSQVFRIPARNIEPPPITQKETSSRMFVAGIGRFEGIFLRILDINEITRIELPEFEGED